MSRERAIKICKNLLSTIHKIELKPSSTLSYIREDMFAVPTARKSELNKKLKGIISKYDIQEAEL